MSSLGAEKKSKNNSLTLGRTSKVTPLPWYKGVNGPLRVFETHYVLPRYWGPVTSSKMATSLGAILDFVKN